LHAIFDLIFEFLLESLEYLFIGSIWRAKAKPNLKYCSVTRWSVQANPGKRGQNKRLATS